MPEAQIRHLRHSNDCSAYRHWLPKYVVTALPLRIFWIPEASPIWCLSLCLCRKVLSPAVAPRVVSVPWQRGDQQTLRLARCKLCRCPGEVTATKEGGFVANDWRLSGLFCRYHSWEERVSRKGCLCTTANLVTSLLSLLAGCLCGL